MTYGLQVNHRQGCNAGGCETLASRRWMGSSKDGYDQHIGAHEKRAAEERPASADTLNEEEQEE